MWSYLAHGTKESDLLFWGYISLKEIQKSLLYTAWDGLNDIDLSQFEEAPKIIAVDTVQHKEQLELYLNFEKQKVDELKQCHRWEAHPLNKDSCSFCNMTTLCARG